MTKAFAAIGVAAVCVAGLALAAGAVFFLFLPDARDLKKCMTTSMYHVRLCDSDPAYTPLPQISPYIVGAVIISEDASFYSHPGVDINEMKESLEKDISQGRFARGASTITQQLAKNVFLNKNKSLLRKAEEIYLAFQIEKLYTKARILTMYLNVVQWGPNIFGIKAATNYYFHRPPSEVTPEQAAFLAFLLPNPEKYHQSFQKRQLTPFAEKMVKTILHKMVISNKISEAEYQAAVGRVTLFPWDGAIVPAAAQQGGAAEPDTGSGTMVPVDESNQDENNFKFDFDPDNEK